MKKILPVIIFTAFCSSASFSQISKGSLLLGGDVGFNTYKSTDGVNENKNNGFYFSPTIGVATKQNKLWGGSLIFGTNKSTNNPGNYSQKNQTYGAGIFCRTYIPVFNKWLAFYQLGGNASFGKSENINSTSTSSESKNFGIGLNITPGISYKISKKVYLESGFNNIAALNYQHNSTTYNNSTSKTTSNAFGFSSSLSVFSNSLYFGFRFIIPKKG